MTMIQEPVKSVTSGLGNVLHKSNWRTALTTVAVVWLLVNVFAVCVRKSSVDRPIPPTTANLMNKREPEPNKQGLDSARLGYNDAALTYFSMVASGNEFSASGTAANLIGTNNKATVESMIAQGAKTAEQRKAHLQKASAYIREDLENARLWHPGPGTDVSQARMLEVLTRNAQSVDLQLKLDL